MPTAEEAQNYIAGKTSRTRRPTIPAEFVEGHTTIKIFNIYKKAHAVNLGSVGTRVIPACQPGQPYSEPCLVPSLIFDEYPVDMDSHGIKTAFNMFRGMDVARDVVGIGPHKEDSANLTHWGVFIAAGDKPTQEELDKAKESLKQTMLKLVSQADQIHMEGPLEAKNITSQHREAAKFLNLKKDWLNVSEEMAECPACFESIKPNSAICKECDAVLDDERAKKFKLGPYKHLHLVPQPVAVAEPETKESKAKGK